MKLSVLIDDDLKLLAIFFYLMFLPVLRYCRLSDLKRCILSALLLLKYSRYKPEIFSDRRLKTEIVHEGWKSYILPKASGLAWTRKCDKKIDVIFRGCRCLSLLPKFFLKTYNPKKKLYLQQLWSKIKLNGLDSSNKGPAGV